MHCRNEDSVSKVCSFFAKPIYMDDPETHRDKGQFVRVMVEVKVKDDLPDSMVVDIHGIDCHVELEYEWKPVACKLCQRVDHNEERCPLKVTQPKAKPKKTVDQYVIKQKGKMIEDKDANQVIDDMPARRVQKEVIVPTSNTFALLEDNEDANVVVTPLEVVDKEQLIEAEVAAHLEEVENSNDVVSPVEEVEKGKTLVFEEATYLEDNEDTNGVETLVEVVDVENPKAVLHIAGQANATADIGVDDVIETVVIEDLSLDEDRQVQETPKSQMGKNSGPNQETPRVGKQSKQRNKPYVPPSDRITRGMQAGSGSLPLSQ
ncbi:uncharacterized protein LOC132299877 [Cornus florida]|uniref:uncharacterized protein LOC132299877 n=1 Tax=Cornus florida TaxID=4283 RepID=UPI00289B86CA|nr:uncharacterized protein LOC132299877 [Cornus florida]XP_059652729.1 uncharacterized protein LOC132299877 [Cornus florida]XP_059652730.1 uncharacterized protein LOC132299877 [Cornus florida]XP_059652733.1 uncharacterized protein LOC132299877 [Cornus florida]XP_059652734.1 uncharacterized protein LOC132299877 [Cornus florida]